MKKSKKMYRLAFFVGLILAPVIIMTNLRELWNLSGIIIGILFSVMLSLTFYAIKLEERGE